MIRIPLSTVALLCLVLASSPVFAEDCRLAARLSGEANQAMASNPELAEQKLREAVGLCGRSAALHYNLGVALYSRDKSREAEQQFEDALRIKPDFAKAMNALAAVLFTKKAADFERAVRLVSKAIELEPMNRQFRDTLELISASVDLAPPTLMQNHDALAVVIGNRNYKDPGIPAVDFADRDAEVMKKYLVESLGFREGNVLFYADATFTDFLKLFGDSGDHKGILYNRTRAGRSDVFIYYAGHGAPDTNSKKAYLAPADMDPYAVKHTAYSLDLMYDNLAKLSREKAPKSLTLVLDACFSGASGKGMIIKDASPIALEISSPVLTLRDATVFASSQGDQISSWYPEQRHSLFTYVFLRAMKDALINKKTLTAGDIEKKLLGRDGVNDYALRLYSREQVPQVMGSRELVIVK